MAAEAAQQNKIKDLLLGQDVSGQVELLLNLLSDAASGKELSNVLSEVIQVGGVEQITPARSQRKGAEVCWGVFVLLLGF